MNNIRAVVWSVVYLEWLVFIVILSVAMPWVVILNVAAPSCGRVAALAARVLLIWPKKQKCYLTNYTLFISLSQAAALITHVLYKLDRFRYTNIIFY